jgi:hypothetical protein
MDLRTVRMLKDERGSPDGVHLRPYYAGKRYDIPSGLARAFVEDIGCAEYVEREQVMPAVADFPDTPPTEKVTPTRKPAQRK